MCPSCNRRLLRVRRHGKPIRSLSKCIQASQADHERKIWKVNGNLICRGVIATPLLADPFEINLNTPIGPKPPHSTAKCNTTLPPQPIINPITGLIIHPIPLETTAPPLIPLYTAVRLSATATNPQWTESNHHQHPTSAPQWLTTIQALVNRHVPLGQAVREGDVTAETDEDGEDGIVRDPDENEEYNNSNKVAADDEDDEEEEEADPDADFDPWANEGPDVYPYNMRVWGIARSPGGGSTAVLATPLLTQRPMRGAWGAHRSRVLFGWRTRVGEPKASGSNETGGSSGSSTAPGAVSSVVDLTTEGRLWEWMYGGGPGIPGLTPRLEPDALEDTRRPGAAQHAQDEAAMARRARVREICLPFVAAQRCEICDQGSNSAITPVGGQGGSRVLDARCAKGHRVAVCGVTGLAIMAPGISRACGVCQSRIIGWAYLLDKVLKPAGVGEAVVAFMKGEMGRDVCARCGGKYLD